MATESHDTATRRHEQRGKRASREIGEQSTGRLTRAATGLVGGALLIGGLRRRGRRGIAMVLTGGWLVVRALGRRPGTRAPDAASGLGHRLGSSSTGASDTAVTRSITIGEPAADLHEIWRDPDQLSEILGQIAEVTATDEDLLRWTVELPGGRALSWDTRIVAEEPGDHLRWETPVDAVVSSEGELRFDPAPGEHGTEVTLTIDFDPPGGAVGAAALDRLDVVPETVVATALRRYKSLAETGEIPTLEGNPSGRGSGDLV